MKFMGELKMTGQKDSAFMGHDGNWMQHDLAQAFQASRAGDADALTDALCTVALNWDNEEDICYEVKCILNKAVKVFGIRDSLEIAGTVGLVSAEGSAVHQTVKEWYLGQRKEPSLAP